MKRPKKLTRKQKADRGLPRFSKYENKKKRKRKTYVGKIKNDHGVKTITDKKRR